MPPDTLDAEVVQMLDVQLPHDLRGVSSGPGSRSSISSLEAVGDRSDLEHDQLLAAVDHVLQFFIAMDQKETCRRQDQLLQLRHRILENRQRVQLKNRVRSADGKAISVKIVDCFDI